MAIKPIKFPPIRYQLKDSGANPFDMEAKENIFFFDDEYSCLSKNIQDLRPFCKISNQYVVFEMERMNLVENGKVLKRFPKGENQCYVIRDNKPVYAIVANQLIDYSFHSQDRKIERMSYWVIHENDSFGGLYSFIWNNYGEALNRAIHFSAETKCAVLVVQCISIDDRH